MTWPPAVRPSERNAALRDLLHVRRPASSGQAFPSGAAALNEHLTGPVADSPHRLGKALDRPFDDVLATRRGDYRVLYTIDDRERVVTVLALAHRRDAYRPRSDLTAWPGSRQGFGGEDRRRPPRSWMSLSDESPGRLLARM